MDIFTKEHPKLLGTVRKFAQYGQSGAWVSALLPHMAEVVDDLTFVKSAATDVFNHAPAKLFANTGTAQFGRPSMGSWVTYGIGSESADLPGFVVLAIRPARAAGRGRQLGERVPPLDLPGRAAARRRRADLEPGHAAGISRDRQRRTIEAVTALNRAHLDATADPEIATRITAYEVAFRMQTSAPTDRPGLGDRRDA